MKWRQSEERKSWSRSLSSSSLAPLGKAVRFLKCGKEAVTGDWPAQGTTKTPGPRATLALHHAKAGFRRTSPHSYSERFCFSPEAGPACRAGLRLLRALDGSLEGFNAVGWPWLGETQQVPLGSRFLPAHPRHGGWRWLADAVGRREALQLSPLSVRVGTLQTERAQPAPHGRVSLQ